MLLLFPFPCRGGGCHLPGAPAWPGVELNVVLPAGACSQGKGTITYRALSDGASSVASETNLSLVHEWQLYVVCWNQTHFYSCILQCSKGAFSLLSTLSSWWTWRSNRRLKLRDFMHNTRDLISFCSSFRTWCICWKCCSRCSLQLFSGGWHTCLRPSLISFFLFQIAY